MENLIFLSELRISVDLTLAIGEWHGCERGEHTAYEIVDSYVFKFKIRKRSVVILSTVFKSLHWYLMKNSTKYLGLHIYLYIYWRIACEHEYHLTNNRAAELIVSLLRFVRIDKHVAMFLLN